MNEDYGRGSFLIANPVLPDPNFSRTVVLLCNHDEQGSFGLVVNRQAELDATEILESINFPGSTDYSLYVGGPVSPSQMFYLYRSNRAILGADLVCDDIYVGMRLDMLSEVVESVEDPQRDIRFYVGYSGWGAGQLEGEMERKSWLTCGAKSEFVFHEDESRIWAGAVKSLGEEYEYLVNAPINPQWN